MNWQRAIDAAICGLVAGLIVFGASWIIIVPTLDFRPLSGGIPLTLQEALVAYSILPLIVSCVSSLVVYATGGRWLLGGIIAPFVIVASFWICAQTSIPRLDQLIVSGWIIGTTVVLLLSSITSSVVTPKARLCLAVVALALLVVCIYINVTTFISIFISIFLFFTACALLLASMALFSSAPPLVGKRY